MILIIMIEYGYTLCNQGGYMKDVGMRIRIEPELRSEFVEICKKNDIPAAQVIRNFMRQFVQSNTSNSNNKFSQKLANK